MPHQWIPNSSDEIKLEMLRELGFSNLGSLFASAIGASSEVEIPSGLSEMEVLLELKETLSMNRHIDPRKYFVGGIPRFCYVPAAVDELASRQEFYTSYTQYQPEVSQGALQALFEYQSLICELTGMDVANASMYDYTTATAEALLMSARVTRRREVVVVSPISEELRSVIETYLEPTGIVLREVMCDLETGSIPQDRLEQAISEDTAALFFENPAFTGVIYSDPEMLVEAAHRKGALAVVGVDLISLALIKPPSEYGADIVTGEAQPLGNYPALGGVLAGILACRWDDKLIWQMPGRLVGITTDADGTRSYVLTLQTREQHIRREKATSNICTNSALNAIRAAIYLALLGKSGLRELAERLISYAAYLASLLDELPWIKAPAIPAPFFRDFAIKLSNVSAASIREKLAAEGFLFGRPFEPASNALLIGVNEFHSASDIEHLIKALGEVA